MRCVRTWLIGGNNMLKSDAMYRMFSLAAEAAKAGAPYDGFMQDMKYLDKINLESVQTDGQLLDAIEHVKPTWKSVSHQ